MLCVIERGVCTLENQEPELALCLERVFFRFKEGTSAQSACALLREVAEWPGVFGVPCCSQDALGADGSLIHVLRKESAVLVSERLRSRDEVQQAEILEPVRYTLGSVYPGMLSYTTGQ